jgi:RNA polymerase sigma-70 factor (ECF subfamily)
VRLAKSSADAEDLVHDTWLRAVGSFVRFGWQSSLRTWLTGILLNRLRELRRAAHLEVPIDEAIGAIGEGGVIAETADPIDLERAVMALPPGFRDVLVLHDVEGFTHAEIGLMLGIQPGTSKSQLARARRALRRRLTDERETAHAPE